MEIKSLKRRKGHEKNLDNIESSIVHHYDFDPLVSGGIAGFCRGEAAVPQGDTDEHRFNGSRGKEMAY
jgi:hypothetical protein